MMARRGALSDEAEGQEFGEGFAEGGAVAEVAAGDDDPVGDIPIEAFEDAVHDGFLAFEAEGVDGVHEVEAELRGDYRGRGGGRHRSRLRFGGFGRRSREPGTACRRRFCRSR